MSANNANAVYVTKPKATGGLYHTLDTTVEIPKKATTPLDPKFKNLGFIGPDGISRTQDKEMHEVLAAGGVKVKTVPKGVAVDYELTIMQTDFDGLTAVFGPENVTQDEDGEITVAHNSKEMPVGSWVFEMADGLNSWREVVPRAQVTSVAGITMGTGEETLYSITVSALEDETGTCSYSHIGTGDGPAALQDGEAA